MGGEVRWETAGRLTLLASKRTIASVPDEADKNAADAADLAISACLRSEDFREGRRAFAEKRRPEFRGQ